MIAGRIRDTLLGLLLVSSAASGARPDAAVADYDAHLCRHAQRFLVNADEADFPVVEQAGYGNGFHVIQMDVDAHSRQVSIAMMTETAEFQGRTLATHVACKTVDRARINDVLGLRLPGPEHQCREINEHTHERALDTLSAAERSRYLNDGRRLTFADDFLIETGGEWLPKPMDDFVRPGEEDMTILAPSVRVPWSPDERQFYQGTQHCKLLTLAGMLQWMRRGAFEPDARPVPIMATECSAPSSMTSQVGSCLFYFAPAGSMFCQDFSGSDWTTVSAREECGLRHADEAALAAAENRYTGAGGVFSSLPCRERTDTPEFTGTCVFHCRSPEETLWHVGGPMAPEMTRGCELFVPLTADRSIDPQ